jgi:hypothetical protein
MNRPDGRRIKSIAPFSKIIPYIMSRRYDATNFMTVDFPYEPVAAYISEQKKMGEDSASLMSCTLAAYIRTVAKYPEINRFVISKKIYARNGIWVSFVTLKDNWSGEGEQAETVVKLRFSGHETIGEISKAVDDAIEKNRKPAEKNSMDLLLGSIFAVPLLPSAIVSALKVMDKLGVLPRSVVEASPFHTSIFFTNMASIRAYPIYHHIYEFGTTSVFISLGMDLNNRKRYQMKIATDERICSGSTYVRAMHYFFKNLRHPEYLETPPSSVNGDMR